jgi:DnaJ-class molecular chaperone
MAAKVSYKVNRVTETHKECYSCKGTGTKKISMGGGNHKTVSCSTCSSTGVSKGEHIEEVDLIEALINLGLVSIEK